MIPSAVQHTITGLLREKAGAGISSLRFSAVGGGSINQTYQIETNTNQKFFCKLNFLSKFPGLFRNEQQGLELLGRQQLIRTPEVIAYGETGDHQWLILEWIEQGLKTNAFWQLFGEQLAALHAVQSSSFGLDTDNYMGALVQPNRRMHNWCDFFIEQRLEPLIHMAVDRRLLPEQHVRQFERLYGKLQEIFPPVQASLLHGDLWSGNYLCDAQGRPVLIDPAVYYGHSSVDIGMTTLFGGFGDLFYESYRQCRPFAPNYREQWEVANLYPLLIHLNLFGQGYLADIIGAIHRF